MRRALTDGTRMHHGGLPIARWAVAAFVTMLVLLIPVLVLLLANTR